MSEVLNYKLRIFLALFYKGTAEKITPLGNKAIKSLKYIILNNRPLELRAFQKKLIERPLRSKQNRERNRELKTKVFTSPT